MIKEIGLGSTLGVVIALLWAGINVYPVLLLLGLGFLLYKVMEMKGGVKSFQPLNSYNNSSISFEDIGGQNPAKRQLREALDFVKFPQKIDSMGIRPLKGILLVGPPGTGKTLLAKAAASYTDSVFFSAAGSEFIEMYAGVGAQRIRKIFKKARESAKKKGKNSAIVFIDEIEILGTKRGNNSSHMEYEQTLNQFLVELDGIATDDEVRVLVVGATNRPDLLDDAVLRPGRFDRIVQVDLPDFDSRLHILKIHTKNKPLEEDVNLDEIAKETFSFSGAHLESVANEAAIHAFRDASAKLKRKHFYEAIDKVIMGEKLERRPDKEEALRVAIHETGHAVVSETISPSSVSTVTIMPRGKAMGYMRQVPEKESYLYTKEKLEGQIAVLIGGALSEEEILGDRSTGAANDFQQAVELAKKIVASGMSSLGIISINDLPSGTLHKHLQEIISDQEEFVRELITKYRDMIEHVANYLLDRERISGQYLRELISKEKDKSGV